MAKSSNPKILIRVRKDDIIVNSDTDRVDVVILDEENDFAIHENVHVSKGLVLKTFKRADEDAKNL